MDANGHAQARALASLVVSGHLPQPTKLTASPKKRARQTLEALQAQSKGLVLNVDDRLDEHRAGETRDQWENRIRSWIKETQKSTSDSVVYICSHLDWLEAAMVLFDSTMSDFEIASNWSNGSYRIMSFKEGLWHLSATGIIHAQYD